MSEEEIAKAVEAIPCSQHNIKAKSVKWNGRKFEIDSPCCEAHHNQLLAEILERLEV